MLGCNPARPRDSEPVCAGAWSRERKFKDSSNQRKIIAVFVPINYAKKDFYKSYLRIFIGSKDSNIIHPRARMYVSRMVSSFNLKARRNLLFLVTI